MDLAARADVVVEDYRPGVLAGLGLGAEDFAAVNPRLIHCSVTLCGHTGPLRDKPGHDPIALALSGALSRAGDREERPSALGLAAADVLTGTNAALAILAAVARRTSTGEGATIDIAMTDAALCLNANVVARHPDPETIPPRHRRRVDTGIWQTRDGGFIATSDMEPRYWARFCETIGRPDFIPHQTDPERRDEIAAELAAVFLTRDRAEWERILQAAGTQFAPVLSVSEALAAPHHRARGSVRDAQTPSGTTLTQLAAPVGPSLRRTTSGSVDMPGDSADGILADLGYSKDRIASLKRSGALGGG